MTHGSKLPEIPEGSFSITRSQWNDLMGKLERVLNLTAGPGIDISDGPGGIAISLAYPDLARFVIFRASTTFAVTDASVEATVVLSFGGREPIGSGGSITVYNLETDTPGLYIFSASTTYKIGVALYDDVKDRYRMIQLEC